jgi:acyl-ACP thioesterase
MGPAGAVALPWSVVEHQFNELPPHTPGVRTFSHERWPSFADCAPSGRIRLDAVACWLQDVAYADVADVELALGAVWVVRRTRIRVRRFPRFGERFTLTTFCSGFGRMWAERRTDVRRAGEDRPDVQAVSLWVHLDPANWRPVPLSGREIEIYGGDALTRRVSARLRHPTAGEAADGDRAWTFRATECDIADHVNNAAYWQPLEEELLAGPDPEHIDVEVEYRAPAQPGTKKIVRQGGWRWIVGQDGELHASIAIAIAGSDER